MVLTKRDETLLLHLHQYGFLTTRQLAGKFFPGVALTTVLRRLRSLEGANHIQRITGLEGGSLGWGLTKAAAQKFLPTPSKVNFPRISLDHDLKLISLRLRLEEAGMALSWRPEHEIRAKVAQTHGIHAATEKVIPDALMGVEAGGEKNTVAVELELFAKNQHRYRDIFWDYRSKKNLWAFWYVVAHAGIGRQLERAAKAALYSGGQPFFLWSVFSEVMESPISASVHGSRKYALSELFRPAHAPAQGVSRDSEADRAGDASLSASTETKTPTPTPT